MFPLSVCGLRNPVGIVIVCESWEDDTHPPYLSPLSRLCGRKQVADLWMHETEQQISILFTITVLAPMR